MSPSMKQTRRASETLPPKATQRASHMSEHPNSEQSFGAMRFGPDLMARLDALAAFTEVDGQLTRRYLSPAHIDVMRQVEAWMARAGMSVRIDPLLSVFGR